MRSKQFQKDRASSLALLFLLSSFLGSLVSIPTLHAEEVEVLDFGEELDAPDSASPSPNAPEANTTSATSPSNDAIETLDFGDELGVSTDSPNTAEPATATSDPQPTENITNTSLDRTQFSGEWHSRLRTDLGWSTSEDVFEMDNGLKLGLRWEQSNRFRVVINGHINYWFGVSLPPEEGHEATPWTQNPHYALSVTLDEAYLNWRFDHVSLTLGNVVVAWGSTLLSQPANVVNTVDHTVILGPSAGRRIAQPTLVVDVFYNNWGLQFLLLPFFTPNTQWVFGRDSASAIADNTVVRGTFPMIQFLPALFSNFSSQPLQQFLLSAGTPSLSPLNASVGVRLTSTFANTDIGIGYFFGWDHDPMIQMAPELRTALKSWRYHNPTQGDLADPSWWGDLFAPFMGIDPGAFSFDPDSDRSPLKLSYARLHSLEIDFSRYFGQIGVKFDAVVHPAKTFVTTQLESVRRPNISTALELNWDHIFTDDSLLSLNLGGFFDYAAPADAPITQLFVSQKNRGHANDELLLYPDGMLGGLAFQGLSYINPLDITIQLFLRTDLTKPDLLTWIDISRPIYGDIRIALGLVHFLGPPVKERFSAGGLYKRDSAIYLSFQGAI